MKAGFLLIIFGLVWLAAITWFMVGFGLGIGIDIPKRMDRGVAVFLANVLLILVTCGWILPVATGSWMLIKSRGAEAQR